MRSSGLLSGMGVVLVAVSVGVGTAAGEGDNSKSGEDNALLDRWKREALEYRIVGVDGQDKPLSFKAEPVLRWTNPVRETDGGLSFLWLERGRPVVVACFYRVRYEGKLTEAHEFLSLATMGLRATLASRSVWAPDAPGVEFRPVPDAPKPAGTPAERLRQLRTMAREFRATVDADKGRTELRQLSQPVYRYEDRADGALFAFVLTTDPEAWLLIEERQGPEGPAWHYAFARMSDHSLSARHHDRTVWEVPRDTDNGNPTKPYCCRWDVGPRQ